jgi:cyanate lyase
MSRASSEAARSPFPLEPILSAIDCKVTLEKKGERGVITIDAKFLHDKEF